MAILRSTGAVQGLEIAQVALDAGISAFEITVQSEGDLETLSRVAAWGSETGVSVGAGTLLDARTVRAAVDAGATFGVSPGLHPDVVEACRDLTLPLVPGVATATEVAAAAAMGFRCLKAFPAATLGASWFSAMRGPFPTISFMATGGIDATNAALYLDAGAIAVGVGSSLTTGDSLAVLGDLAQAPLD